jgi:alkylation response protein AidB-like acyl-CoA dehydrogenase
MDFAWSSDAQDRIAAARNFAEARLAVRPRTAGFDREAWRSAAAFGALKLGLPKRCGGEEAGALLTSAVFEALGRGGADRGLLFAMGAHLFGCTMPIVVHGAPHHLAGYAEGLGSGELIAALAITEPAGGSSLDLLTTQVAEAPGGFVLNGAKTLISNAGVADVFLVIARQYPDRGAFGLTAFLVPCGAPGLTVKPVASPLGMPGAPVGDLRFDDCFVPTDAMLGRPGSGLKIFTAAMQWERTCILAGFIGAAERDLAHCVAALQSRSDGQGPLYRHQAVSHRLARMRLTLDSARLMLYRAAWSLDRGGDDFALASMAKLAASEAIVAAANDCLRLMAGSAWTGVAAIDAGGALADTIGTLFASGTTEVHLDIVARQLQMEQRRK